MSEEGFPEVLLQRNTAVVFCRAQSALVDFDLESDDFHAGRHFCLDSNNGGLFAREIVGATGAKWPAVVSSQQAVFARTMDRLYIPTPRDASTTIDVLDSCAAAYESLVNVDRNICNIGRLLDEIASRSLKNGGVLKVLDFGCGTGLSLRAAGRHELGHRFDLYGLDGAPHMRQIAAARGLPMAETGVTQVYDGVLASYVIHGGLRYEDCEFIARSLSKRGVFVGNWLHGSEEHLLALLDFFSQRRRGAGEIVRDSANWRADPLVVFQVNEDD